MRISKKTEYALRALTELAMNRDGGNVQAQELARRERIPIKFLEQILLALRKGGIIQSRRGAGGGYTLARLPESISVGEVISLIEGPILLLDCTEDESDTCSSLEAASCGLREVVGELRAAVKQVLGEVSVADICDRTEARRQRQDSVPLYSI
jgi:Rrf2 family protein